MNKNEPLEAPLSNILADKITEILDKGNGSISVDEDGNIDDKNQHVLAKLKTLEKLDQDLDLGSQGHRTFHGFKKYYEAIITLVKQKKYEDARVLCILEVKGLEAYLYSDKKFKYIWPQFIARNRGRWKKWRFHFSAKEYSLDDLRCLITDGILNPELCVKYSFAFTFSVRMLPVPEPDSKYKAVIECKKINQSQRSDLIKFLLSNTKKIAMDYTASEIYKLYVTYGAKVYKLMLPDETEISEADRVEYIHMAAKSKKKHLIGSLQENLQMFDNNKGVYPIEYIIACQRYRKDEYWRNAFFAHCHCEDDWKANNLHLLKRRLKRMKLDDADALYFYITMQHINGELKLLHSMKKGLNQQHNDTSMFPLSELPIDIIHIISKHLTLTSVMALTLTCKSINQTIMMNGETFWKNSLAVTCPMATFDTELSWKNIAAQESRACYNWMKGHCKKVTSFAGYGDCKALNEHWGLFASKHSHKGGLCNCNWLTTHIQTLFNCHTHEEIPQLELRLTDSYKAIFLDSNDYATPPIVAYSPHESVLVIQYDDLVTKQSIPDGRVKYGVVGVDSNLIYFNDCLWDLDEAEPIMKFNIQVSPVASHSIYHKNLHSVILAVEEKLHILDTRSGETIVHNNAGIKNFDMIDDNTIGFIGNGIGTIDLRMIREDYFYKSPKYSEGASLINGRMSRALVISEDSTIQWDFRERSWERLYYTSDSLVNMNSSMLVTKTTSDGELELFNFN